MIVPAGSLMLIFLGRRRSNFRYTKTSLEWLCWNSIFGKFTDLVDFAIVSVFVGHRERSRHSAVCFEV